MPRPIGYRAKKPTPAVELAAVEPEIAVAAGTIDATDSARDLATIHHIDLASISGSGVDGRITKADVEAAVAALSAQTAVDNEAGGEQP